MALTKKQKRKICGKKIGYNTIKEARRAAAMFTMTKNIVTYMKAYQCHCGMFHIGSTKKINWDKVK